MARIDDLRIRKFIYDKYNGRCAYCGKLLGERFTIDHIIPLRRGTKNYDRNNLNSVKNMNPCCFSCNSSKGVFSLEQWRNEINKKYERLLKYESSFNLLVRLDIISRKIEWKFYFEKI